MSTARRGDTVRVHYSGRLEDGTVFDSSEGSDPIEFTIGEGKVIPGFEHAVEGLSEGESTTERIPADRAYGVRRDDLVLDVRRSEFPGDREPSIGDLFEMSAGEGPSVRVRVIDVGDETVTVDANHPLAGKDLTFELELVEIT